MNHFQSKHIYIILYDMRAFSSFFTPASLFHLAFVLKLQLQACVGIKSKLVNFRVKHALSKITDSMRRKGSYDKYELNR